MKVSIGFPVYNSEKTIRLALDSLLKQTYSNFELIISDNASSDRTEEICREYASRDLRIRYIRQAENIGSLANFNFVLQEARGEYFMWAASDDWWDINFIASLLNGLENNPDAAVAFSPYQLVYGGTNTFFEDTKRFNYHDKSTFFRLLKFTWHYNDACIYGLIRTKFIKDLKLQAWAWINADTPYNIAFPIIYSLLSKGNFLIIGDDPLWFKSIRTTNWHSTPFKSNPLFAYFSHVLRKINLFVRSVRYINLGSKSILLTMLILPFLLLRMAYDCMTPGYAALYIWYSGKKLSEMSPHEIWRLGVR